MRPLTTREQRTIRIAGIVIAIYLVLFFSLQVWKGGQRRRAEYSRLYREAAALKQKLVVYEDKALVTTKLMEQFRMDPARLSRSSIVAEATAAIHQAALGGGIQLGPIRETPARAAAKEVTAVQLEGMGQVPAILGFLHGLGSLGYPLVADSLQLTQQAQQPGMVKMNVTIVILDFDQWKAAPEKPNV